MKKSYKILLVLLILLLSFSILVSCTAKTQSANIDANGEVVATADEGGNVLDELANLFFPSEPIGNVKEQVYLGGYPLGMTIDGNGVTVIGLNEFVGAEGNIICPAVESGLRIGDIIIEVDGVKIYNSTKLAELAASSKGRPLEVKYIRGEETAKATITPMQDLTTKLYRIGLWTKDSSSGVGTLTYVRKDLRFGSLGHPICDNGGKIIDSKNGGIYKCKINGIEKGQRGTAGELRGGFSFEDRVGSIYANNKFGVFGSYDKLPKDEMDLLSVASVGEVKQGKAQIYCTLTDNVRRAYDIEIVKASRQRSRDDKGMVIKITDKELLEKTGGIVQGMSGSPIVQNGKLVGAVTHVFVNDPTKGYGIYAEWMLTN